MGILVSKNKEYRPDDILSKKVGVSPTSVLDEENKIVDEVREKDRMLICGNKAFVSACGR
jgi:hypothetical protein